MPATRTSWWRSRSNGDTELHVAVSDDSALSWTPPQHVTTTGLVGIDEPALDCDLDGRVLLVWGSNQRRAAVPIETSRSEQRGLAGSWEASQAAPLAIQPHDACVVASDGELVFIANTDYRDDDGVYPVETSIHLNISCDDGQSWPEELRLDLDEAPYGDRSVQPLMALSASGRIHLTWSEAGFVHVALDAAQGQPRLSHQRNPGAACGPEEHVLAVIPESVDWCTAPSFRWHVDGSVVSGATGRVFVLPQSLPPGQHAVRVEVTCADPAPCGTQSPTRLVFVTAPVVPEPLPAHGPIVFVAADGPSLRLAWADSSPEAAAYSSCRGSIASLHEAASYDHAMEFCHVARAGAFTSAVVPMPADDAYYVLSRSTCLEESLVGTNSFGTPRPLTGNGAPCGPVP